MLPVILGLAVVAGIAGAIYVVREGLGLLGVGLAALRTAGLGALVLLLLNPAGTRHVADAPPTVLLDGSLSMAAAGGQWQRALDTARALAGPQGTILRFGRTVVPFDTTPPDAGSSRLFEPLTAARARGGPVVVITDGELADAASLPSQLFTDVSVAVLARDTAPDAALLDVDVPRRLQRDDSLRLTVTVGAWGALTASAGTLEVSTGARRLALQDIELPPPPGRARRTLTLRPGLLAAGSHVLRVRLTVAGDRERRDDERLRVVDVSEQPAVVVLVDPADWEGRFLVHELGDVAQTTVRGYGRTGRGAWRDMRSLRPVSEATVRGAARAAGLLVVRGSRDLIAADRRGPRWRWPAGNDTAAQFFSGDWYVTGDVPPSPLAGRLAAVPWDSLPPLTGVVPLAPGGDEWVALRARQGRRGAARPVVVGVAGPGGRELTTAGAGLWRWAFRGGGTREAYRALLAAGVEWLLDGGGGRRSTTLTATPVVSRGIPVGFRWSGAEVPDSVVVTARTGETVQRLSLRFDAAGLAGVVLDPGVYRWSAPGHDGGIVAVEEYSDEFPLGPVVAVAGDAGSGLAVLIRHARERWWLYVLVVAAFAAEWAWRQRQGLP